jgi:PTS system nitrogen regulatory IIA component
MKLTDFLSEESIIPSLSARTKEEVLVELATALAATGAIGDVGSAVGVLLEREKLGSTGIGEGIAIPHGKLGELDRVVGVFGRSRAGVEFDSMDGAPVHLLFLLLAPEASASSHLKALARISRLLRDRSFREELLRTESRESLYQLLLREDEKR